MMRRAALLLSLPLTASLLTGCEVLEDYEEFLPTVQFKNLAVDSVNWQGADTRFIFEVHNPNPVEIDLARFNYALAFEEVEWLAGDSPDGLTLEASNASELSLPVSLEFLELYEMVQAVRGLDDIGFALNGNFGFDTSIGPIDLPYTEDGGFPAPRKPQFTYEQLRVRDLSWSGADLALRLNVDNEHGSNLLFNNVNYDISLAGVDVGGGFLDSLGEVEGASNQVVAIPITVNFLDVGTALIDILNGQDILVDLSATMDVDTPFGVVPLDLSKSERVQLQR